MMKAFMLALSVTHVYSKYMNACDCPKAFIRSKYGCPERVCKFQNQVTSHGASYKGDTHTCLCSDGAWTDCTPNQAQPSIVENAINTPQLSTLVAVLTNPAYKPVLDILNTRGPFTVFAPTNEAFRAAGLDTRDVVKVTAILTYHVLDGNFPASALNPSQQVATKGGERVTITKSGSRVRVNNANVVIADVMSSNGVVHVIDAILMPPSIGGGLKSIVENAMNTPSLSTLVSVLTQPAYGPILNVLSGSGPFTVFAPTDAAFAAAGIDVSDVSTVSKVLQYHVLSGVYPSSALSGSRRVPTVQGEEVAITGRGGQVTVNNANVVVPDVQSSNGVVHVIDKVLLPPSIGGGLNSIVENAINTPSLSTLVSVLTRPAYGPILNVLRGSGPFTVFAPTDAAFAAAGIDVSDVSTVSKVLQYHVLRGSYRLSGLSGSGKVPTVQGEEVTITGRGGQVTVNNANVVVPDVQSSNGIVHVIDKVLMPPSMTPMRNSGMRSCFYMNDSAMHGNSLVGDSMICVCNDGAWVNCQPFK